MSFGSPHWLLLIPLLFLLQRRSPQLRLQQPLRAFLLSLLLLALLDPKIHLSSKNLSLWVLVDHSASADESIGARLREWQAILESSKPSDASITYLDFADSVVLRERAEPGGFVGRRAETQVGSAIRAAVGMRDRGTNTRLLLLSDGYSTEPLEDLAGLLRNEEVKLDYRLPPDTGVADARITEIRSPQRVAADSRFLIEIEVGGVRDSTLPITVYRDSELLAKSRVSITHGRGVMRLADQLPSSSGAVRYRAMILPEFDLHPANNWAETWVAPITEREVLIFSGYDTDPLESILKAKGFKTRLVKNSSSAHPGLLSGASLVVMNDIPAGAVPEAFLKSLSFFVEQQGGGLLMTGGRYSFGAGGYYQSAIDSLLPVSMELRGAWQPAATVALVLDRSGSMGATVEGGMGWQSKMDLANEGAARSIALLSERDQLALYAVDTEPHAIIPLATVDNRGEQLMQRARSINAGGGGINVYPGLNRAWKDMEKSEAAIKHIVLFADAADAVEPGDYTTLTADIRKAGGTVSVIALGSQNDKDAEFLRDLAERGAGRIFFVNNAVDIPAVFLQETVAFISPTFITQDTGVLPSPAGWSSISPLSMKWMAGIDGYNATHLKPRATLVLAADTEQQNPLLAVWPKGVGRTAALSLPLDGEYSQRFASWPGYGELLHTLVGWLQGPELPPGVSVRTEVVGSDLVVSLFYDSTWESVFAHTPPELRIQSEPGVAEVSIPWRRLQPGKLLARKTLSSTAMLRGAVVIGEHALPFGPVALGQDPEWTFSSHRLNELRRVSELSGGRELVDLASVWDSPPQSVQVQLLPYILVLFLGVFLLDALRTRLGRTTLRLEFDTSHWRRFKKRQTREVSDEITVAETPASAEGAASSAENDSSSTTAPAADLDGRSRRERFRRAKNRGL